MPSVYLGGLQRIDLLALNGGAVHAILAVQELDDVAHRIAHRAIIPGQNEQTPLYKPVSVGCCGCCKRGAF
jgi:butyrate kinase